MEEYKIVYVFNGFQWLWRQLMLSVLTLRQFIRENIVVFYGSPRYPEHTNWLKSKGCEVRFVETPLNSPTFRASRKYWNNRFYGTPMKLHAYTVKTQCMIHLDCDTSIKGNFLELLNDDYDMLVQKWETTSYVHRENCEKMGFKSWALQMDGFYIFKNQAYLEFKPIYEKYLVKMLNGELIPHTESRLNVNAFNVAINDFRRSFKVKQMPWGCHNYRPQAKYVRHFSHKRYDLEMEEKMFSNIERRLQVVGENGKVARTRTR